MTDGAFDPLRRDVFGDHKVHHKVKVDNPEWAASSPPCFSSRAMSDVCSQHTCIGQKQYSHLNCFPGMWWTFFGYLILARHFFYHSRRKRQALRVNAPPRIACRNSGREICPLVMDFTVAGHRYIDTYFEKIFFDHVFNIFEREISRFPLFT